jgi:hypothetical protein
LIVFTFIFTAKNHVFLPFFIRSTILASRRSRKLEYDAEMKVSTIAVFILALSTFGRKAIYRNHEVAASAGTQYQYQSDS